MPKFVDPLYSNGVGMNSELTNLILHTSIRLPLAQSNYKWGGNWIIYNMTNIVLINYQPKQITNRKTEAWKITIRQFMDIFQV